MYLVKLHIGKRGEPDIWNYLYVWHFSAVYRTLFMYKTYQNVTFIFFYFVKICKKIYKMHKK